MLAGEEEEREREREKGKREERKERINSGECLHSLLSLNRM